MKPTFYNGESGFSPWHDIVGFKIAGEDKVFHPAKIAEAPS